MNKAFFAASGMVTLVFAAGCGSSRKLKSTTMDSTVATAPVITYDTAMRQPPVGQNADVLSAPSAEVVLAQRLMTAPAFATFSGKAKAAYEAAGDRKEFSMVIRIRHGQAIWVSISALGGLVNVARALVTPDSVQVINYLQREAYRLPYAAAGKLLPVSVPFSALENLFTGRPVFEGGQVVALKDEGAFWTVQTAVNGYEQVLGFNKADSALQAAGFSNAAVPGTGARFKYEDYFFGGGFRFAKGREILFRQESKQTTVRLDFDEPVWNRDVEMPFSIPAKYTLK